MGFHGVSAVGLASGLVVPWGCGLSYDVEKYAEGVEPPPVHLDIWPAIESPVPADPEMELRLRHFADGGAELSHVTTPFLLATEGTLALRFANVRLEQRANDQPCG